MAKYDKSGLLSQGYLPTATNRDPEDKPVPVEIKLVVWVHRKAWSEEHGLDINDDFEDSVKDWAREECQELVDNGEWGNVGMVTE